MSNLVTFEVKTNKKREVINITDKLNAIISERGLKDGVATLFVKHTTAALTVADLDPGTDLDLLDVLEKLIPRIKFRHEHNPAHTPDHILSSLIGVSLSLIIQNGEILLGTWQNIVLVELDGPKKREIVFSIQTLT